MARRQEEVRRGYGIDERNRVARIELLRAAVDPSLSRTEDSDPKPLIAQLELSRVLAIECRASELKKPPLPLPNKAF